MTVKQLMVVLGRMNKLDAVVLARDMHGYVVPMSLVLYREENDTVLLVPVGDACEFGKPYERLCRRSVDGVAPDRRVSG